MKKEERYEGIPLENYYDGNFSTGLIWGLALSIPLWTLIILLVKSL
jgi:hypothetical protein